MSEAYGFDFFDLSKDLARLIPLVSVTVKFSPPLGRPSNKRTCGEHKSETEGGVSKGRLLHSYARVRTSAHRHTLRSGSSQRSQGHTLEPVSPRSMGLM